MNGFHDCVTLNKHTFVCFTSSGKPSLYSKVSTDILRDEGIRIYIVNMSTCSEICEEVHTINETIIVFNYGKEVGRVFGASSDQLEYLVSKILCGLPVFERLMV
jgi:hypothetical protein